jgi:hypothetical protein
VPPQVLDVDDLEAVALHGGDRLGEARDPAAGEHVFADEELGVPLAHVADEMQHAEAARLEELRMRAHDVFELVAGPRAPARRSTRPCRTGRTRRGSRRSPRAADRPLPRSRIIASTAATCSSVVFTPVTCTSHVSAARSMKPPKPQPMSTTVSPGCSRILRHTWSILFCCACSTVRVPSFQYAHVYIMYGSSSHRR